MASGRFSGGFSPEKLSDALQERIDSSSMASLALPVLRGLEYAVNMQPEGATLRITRQGVELRVQQVGASPQKELEEVVEVGGGFNALIEVRDGVLSITLAKESPQQTEITNSGRLVLVAGQQASQEQDDTDERLALTEVVAERLRAETLGSEGLSTKVGFLPDAVKAVLAEYLVPFLSGNKPSFEKDFEEVRWASLKVPDDKWKASVSLEFGNVEVEAALFREGASEWVTLPGKDDKPRKERRDISMTKLKLYKWLKDPNAV